MKKALLVIDLQNDYFPGGKFPLWNTADTLERILKVMEAAKAKEIPIILIQHIANTSAGPAPFFNPGTAGAEIHPQIRAAAPDAPVIVKEYADAFVGTNLEQTLSDAGITELLVCGMMTQNCVTHTAISKTAEQYQVSILPDCCTTIDAMIHNIALRAVSTRLALVPSGDIIAGV